MTTETSAVLLQTDLALPKFQGKVRDVYDVGDRLLLVATDRVSAFDVVLPNGIPDKGRVLTQMSAYWFEQTSEVVPNHMIRVIESTKNPDLPVALGQEFIGRTMLVRKAEPVKLEAIVRGYLSGSGWKDYQATGAVCGIPLPAGLRESDALPEAIFTPSTKAEEGHDENISYAQAVAIVGAEVANTVKVRSMSLYMYGLGRAREQGFIIADTKFEFGMVANADGEEEAILIDEALTPDSSRFWDVAAYEPGKPQPSFDKQPLRDWLESTGWGKTPPGPAMPAEVVSLLQRRYVEGFERLTGRALIRPDVGARPHAV
jgi:phosphoribosylaminoimidazole-succinocarboxamide synthase